MTAAADRQSAPEDVEAPSRQWLDEDDYDGEVSPRSKTIASVLAWLCPGLAYWYIGRPVKGLTINLGFVLMIEGFVILLGLMDFFPLLPLLVLVLAWLVFCLLVMLDVREEIEDRKYDERYIVRGVNHVVVYGLVALFTYFAPILISVDLTEKNLVTAVPVESAAMYPSLLPGDVVMLSRHGFDKKGISLGDVVAVQADKESAPVHILRVTAVQGDMLRVVDGEMVYLKEDPLEKEPRVLNPVGVDGVPATMMTMIEENRGVRYPISFSRQSTMHGSVPPLRLEEGELFLLADNRSQAPLSEGEGRIRDSRDFGPRKIEQVKGEPRYILWSTHPESGEVRWGRIGLKVR